MNNFKIREKSQQFLRIGAVSPGEGEISKTTQTNTTKAWSTFDKKGTAAIGQRVRTLHLLRYLTFILKTLITEANYKDTTLYHE